MKPEPCGRYKAKDAMTNSLVYQTTFFITCDEVLKGLPTIPEGMPPNIVTLYYKHRQQTLFSSHIKRMLQGYMTYLGTKVRRNICLGTS